MAVHGKARLAISLGFSPRLPSPDKRSMRWGSRIVARGGTR